MKIEEFIPFGRNNAITREDLCSKTNLSDTIVRRHISGARRSGVVIINLQDGSGYFRPQPDDYEIVHRQWRQERSRAMKILAGNTAASKWLNQIKGQQTIV